MNGSLLGQAELPGVTASVPIMRRFVHGVLLSAGCTHIDDALLLLTEVFTNAIKHTDSGRIEGGSVRVKVARPTDAAVRVSVVDAGSPHTKPELRTSDGESPSGRGLQLVDRLASSWGYYEDWGSQVVWFQVELL
ncbi:ATP-binding protein [Acrocarpospora catenulata]|uniref:ATP-binding protein n=1 Tax=Acrocarpospora catenulata TaxID=2836182 RepID=UPI001BDB6BEA|nr:ATP-binding protein [Acrocarpospora catenulata]